MNKQTRGFTLIELSIALVISSMLTLLLYESFSQAQRSARNSNSLMDAAMVMPVVYNQLEKDFTAMFVPERVFKDLAEKSKKKDASQPAPQAEGADKEKKKQEPFKDIFLYTTQEKIFERMSFISTHSLALYDTVVPHAVRVLYHLEPLADKPGLFSLVRQETTKLDMPLAKFKEEKVRAYDLMRSVKNLKLEFLVPEKEPEEPAQEGKEQKKASQPQAPKKYRTLTTWAGDGGEGEKKPEYLIPAYINVSGIFVDPSTDREYPFEWKFPVPVFDDVALRLKKAQSKKEDTKAAPAPDATGKGKPNPTGQPVPNAQQKPKPNGISGFAGGFTQ